MRTPFFSVIAASIFLVSCQNTGDFASKSSNETPLPDSAIAAKDGSGEEVDGLATAAIDKDKHGGQVQKLFAAYKAPPTGARFTWRSNWASMPDLVTYEVQGLVERGGAEYVALKSVKGLAETTYAYYDTTNFSLKGYRNEQDEALTTFKPVEERYRFPLEKGKQWVSEWKMKDHKTGKVTSGGGVFKIDFSGTTEVAGRKFPDGPCTAACCAGTSQGHDALCLVCTQTGHHRQGADRQRADELDAGSGSRRIARRELV